MVAPVDAARLFGRFVRTIASDPRIAKMLEPAARGARYANEKFVETKKPTVSEQPAQSNPLLDYFLAHEEGPGIFKFMHYFDIYHRHFSRFIGKKVRVMEVGVYSGGSLGMWRDYFGPDCTVYGVDIEPACLSYKRDGVEILIGDQGDPRFWKQVKESVPEIDIFIDDGSHFPEHQIVTLEEMLPHVAPGGVFLCEDIYGYPAGFLPYLFGLSGAFYSATDNDFLKAVDSIHFYPSIGVIEKAARYGEHRSPMEALRRGTEWAPFDSYARKGRGLA